MARGLVEVRVGRGLQIEPFARLRNERGQYTSEGANAQLNANRAIANELQAQVVQRMKNHISFGKRASASTGHLVKVTADAANQVVSKEFIGVGIESHLNGASAYWRIFEEGTSGFVGTLLFGMKGARFPNAHGDKPGIRTLSEARMAELEEAAENAAENGEKMRASGTVFVVQHEIKPANIYGSVASDNRTSTFPSISAQFARRVLHDALKEVVVVGTDFVPPGVR